MTLNFGNLILTQKKNYSYCEMNVRKNKFITPPVKSDHNGCGSKPKAEHNQPMYSCPQWYQSLLAEHASKTNDPIQVSHNHPLHCKIKPTMYICQGIEQTPSIESDAKLVFMYLAAPKVLTKCIQIQIIIERVIKTQRVRSNKITSKKWSWSAVCVILQRQTIQRDTYKYRYSNQPCLWEVWCRNRIIVVCFTSLDESTFDALPCIRSCLAWRIPYLLTIAASNT